MGKYEIAVFDVDGTLLDTTEGVLASVKYTIDKMGFEPLSEDVLKTFIGPSLYDSFTSKCHVDHDQALWLVAKYRERYNVTGLYETSIYDGIPQTLKDLKEKGTKIGVATRTNGEDTGEIRSGTVL